MAKQKAENHHFVPRFYLRNFAQKGKKTYLTAFYQFSDERVTDVVCPVESICYKSYYYGEDGQLEHNLALKEGVWSQVIKNIINKARTENEEISATDVKSIKEFILYQDARIPATINYTNSQMRKIKDKMLCSIGNTFRNDENEILMKPSELVEYADGMLYAISDLSISIIIFRTEEKLVTSDAPVIQLNPLFESKGGLLSVGCVLILPLAEEVAILLYDSKVYGQKTLYVINSCEEDVKKLNIYQAINAEERVISIYKNQLKKIKDDCNVKMYRKEKYEKNEIDSGRDGRKTIIAVKGQITDYKYHLSFLKIPRQIKKIPASYRMLISRNIDPSKGKVMLYQHAYLPKGLLLERGYTKEQVKKRTKSILSFLDYMYDYWGTPTDEQGLSNQLIQDIYSARIRFFGKE